MTTIWRERPTAFSRDPGDDRDPRGDLASLANSTGQQEGNGDDRGRMNEHHANFHVRLRSAIESVAEALRVLWAHADFRPYLYSTIRPRRIRTTFDESVAEVLPFSGLPIRGSKGVATSFDEQQSEEEEEATRRLLTESLARSTQGQPPFDTEAQRLDDLVNQLWDIIDEDSPLSYQLSIARGYKTWSLEEFQQHRASVKWDRHLPYVISFGDLFALALVANGFSTAARSEFAAWSEAIERLHESLTAIYKRTAYRYDVRVFLNSPLIDDVTDAEIAALKLGDRPITVRLGYATDELLTTSEYEAPDGYGKTNTVIRYEIELPVSAHEDEYLAEYRHAAELAEVAVDALRLLRPKDDIGVLSLEVVPEGPLTPAIRRTWAYRYRPELARFHPVRFEFALATPPVVSREELDRLRHFISLLVSEKGRGHAMQQALRRFRNSFERYTPTDAERLLEYAIALEALYLSDIGTDRGELTFRLALRLARFLETDLTSRSKTFALTRALYSFRSRIAHGGSIDKLKSNDRARLEEVLNEAPSLVARSIALVLESDIGEGYWKAVELG